MWLTSEGVRLALRGYADRIRVGQDPPVERVHAQFIEKGGRFYVCPICFNERDLADAVRRRRRHDLQLLTPKPPRESN
jgi:predicted peroxiredoxin